jgi:hypothetical protein
MKYLKLIVLFLSFTFLFCDRTDLTSFNRDDVVILQLEKIDPNIIELTIQNCSRINKYVLIDLYAVREDSVCGSIRFNLNDRNAMAPDEICCERAELYGIINHQQYDKLVIDKLVQDFPIR